MAEYLDHLAFKETCSKIPYKSEQIRFILHASFWGGRLTHPFFFLENIKSEKNKKKIKHKKRIIRKMDFFGKIPKKVALRLRPSLHRTLSGSTSFS